MTRWDPKPLAITLDGSVILAEVAGHVHGIIDDLKSAATAQHAYKIALADVAAAETGVPGGERRAFDGQPRMPHVLAQAWVRSLRDIAVELVVLANEAPTAEAARHAATLFGKAFPGIASAVGPMRVTRVDPGQVVFAVGPARFPVSIDDRSVQALEAVVHGLLERLPKAPRLRVVR